MVSSTMPVMQLQTQNKIDVWLLYKLSLPNSFIIIIHGIWSDYTLAVGIFCSVCTMPFFGLLIARDVLHIFLSLVF